MCSGHAASPAWHAALGMLVTKINPLGCTSFGDSCNSSFKCSPVLALQGEPNGAPQVPISAATPSHPLRSSRAWSLGSKHLFPGQWSLVSLKALEKSLPWPQAAPKREGRKQEASEQRSEFPIHPLQGFWHHPVTKAMREVGGKCSI